MHPWRNWQTHQTKDLGLNKVGVRVQVPPGVRYKPLYANRKSGLIQDQVILRVQLSPRVLSGCGLIGKPPDLGSGHHAGSNPVIPICRCRNWKTGRFQKPLYEGSSPFRRSKRKENNHERTNTDTKLYFVRGGSSGVEQQPYKLCVEGPIPSRPIKCLDSSVGRAGGC